MRYKTLLTSLPAIALAGPALAFSCGFERECYEAEPCGESSFTLDVDIENKTLSTDFGDLIIVAVKRQAELTTLFATGAGAEYLMSVSAEAARLSAQMNAGPVVITYLGRCEDTD